MKQYSIIIPHKDIPQLLQRCLDSIPVREDVQVIVVDDNSSPEVVDFAHFPGLERSDVEVYFTKEGKGAGYARNVGIDHAVGKWLMFVDADDYLAEDYERLIDEMRDAEEDVVHFGCKSVLSENTAVLSDRGNYLNDFIRGYLDGSVSEEDIRYRFDVPVCKLIKKELVDRCHIRFSETRWANDVYFSGQVGHNANKIRVSEIVGYVITERQGSLVSNHLRTSEEILVRYGEVWKVQQLCKGRGVMRLDSYLRQVYDRFSFLGCMKFCWENRKQRQFACTFFKFSIRQRWGLIKKKIVARIGLPWKVYRGLKRGNRPHSTLHK